MKKLVLLCSVLFFGCSVWGMEKYSVDSLTKTLAAELTQWFAKIDQSSLPKKNSAALGRLLFEIATKKEADWIAEFVKIEALKNLLLLQDSKSSTILHYLANRAPINNDQLLEVLNLLDFALPTLRPLKNADGKTAFDLYIQRTPAQQDDTVKNMLNPAQPTTAAEPISPEQLTALAGALSILNSSIGSEDTESLFGDLFN